MIILGTGEQIMRTMITTKCAQRITQEDNIQSAVTTCLQKDFLGMYSTHRGLYGS